MAEKLPIHFDNLKNKCAIITGGASGIGLATATKFAECGAYVTLADMNEEAGQKIASDMVEKGHKVTFVKTDVTNWNSAVAAFKHAINFSPRKTLDIAGLYAGIGGANVSMTREIERADPEPSLDRDPIELGMGVIQVNLLGVYRCARLALHYFRLKPVTDAIETAPGRKSLILVSSLAGYGDFPSTEYCTAKYGVRGLFRSLRLASRSDGSNFRVNVLAPGFVATPMVLNMASGGEFDNSVLDGLFKNKMFVPFEYLADVASLCATNDDVDGRSFSIWPHGYIDNNEEREGMWAAASIFENTDKTGYNAVMGL